MQVQDKLQQLSQMLLLGTIQLFKEAYSQFKKKVRLNDMTVYLQITLLQLVESSE